MRLFEKHGIQNVAYWHPTDEPDSKNVLIYIIKHGSRDAAKKYCLLGRAEDCLEQMQALVDAGSRGFIFSPLMDATEFLDRAEDTILPELGNLRI